MSALVRCPKCPKEIAYPWPFAEIDLYCPLCGAQTIGLRANQGAIFSDSGHGEVWAYLDPGSDKFEIALELETARVGTRRDSTPATKPIPLVDFIEWERAGGTIRETNGNTVRLAIKWNPSTGRVSITPEKRLDTERKPAVGLFGELYLPGLVPESFNFRLWPRPAVPLRIDPAPEADEVSDLTAYLDQATQTAFVVLTLNSNTVPVAIDKIVLPPKARETIRGICKSVSNLPRSILRPGQPEPFKIEFKECSGTLDRVPFDLSFHLRGFPDPVNYPSKLSLRQKPSITIFSSGAMAQEDITVNLGGRPIVFDLYLLENAGGETASARPDPAGAIRIEPTEHASWLQPMQRLPERISNDPNRPTRLRMKIDTLGVSRATGELAGQSHDVAVVIRDIGGFDLARFPLRVRFVRMPQMSGVLAFDWGTTNNCAALGEVGSIRSEALDPTRPEEFERFSSALFVKSVESEEAPELAVGTEAHELISVSANSQCVLRGLKRLFLAGHPIRLRDPAGRQRDYPVEVVVAEYLRRMIDAVEQLLDREIGYFGLTYPTKWPVSVRDRLDQTLDSVRSAVLKHRPERRIDILPPRLDEATAVAFSALRSLWSESVKGADRIDLEKGAVVVAYDFGGGTVDTVVLDVTSTPADELQTQLIGVGGRPDFGGDDITRGIVRLLCDRIAKYLKSQVDSHEFRILFPNEPDRDTFPLAWNIAARQNAEKLWLFSETIKRDLCQPVRESAIHPVVAAFGEQGLNKLEVFPNSPDDVPQSLDFRLQEVSDIAVDLRTELFAVLQFELPDLYNVAIDGHTGTTIRDRLVESFEQLRAQLAEAPADRPRLIVLAGGGCRLPLIQELARSYLIRPELDRIDFQEQFAKQRVAHGKAWELTFGYTGDDAMLKYTPPGDVSQRSLMFIRQTIRGEKSELVVPTGSPLHAPDLWHPAQVHLDARRVSPLILWAREWIGGKWQPVKVGEFERTPTPIPSSVVGLVKAGICISRDDTGEQQIFLRLQKPGSDDWLEPWKLIAAGSWGDAARILQGFADE